MGAAAADLAQGLSALELVPGDVDGILGIADELRRLATVLDDGGASLSRVEVTRWRGEAALVWELAVAREPGRWRAASDAFTSASTALERYASALAPARELAAEAVVRYRGSASPLLVGAVTGDLFAAMEAGQAAAVALLDRARTTVRGAAGAASACLTSAMAAAPDARRFFESTVRPAGVMEAVHVGLDGLGMLPMVGFVPDLANAAWYASQERYLEAGLSAASAVPGPGDVVGGGVLAGTVVAKTVDDLDGVAALGRAAREVDLGRGVAPGLFPSRPPGALLGHVPYGFESLASWETFSREVTSSLEAAGVTDAVVFLRGSSVTGFRYSSGESIALSGPGDYDLAVVSPQLFAAAQAASNVYLRSGRSRTTALLRPQLFRLGLLDAVNTLNTGARPRVSLMIYRDAASIVGRGDAILMP